LIRKSKLGKSEAWSTRVESAKFRFSKSHLRQAAGSWVFLARQPGKPKVYCALHLGHVDDLPGVKRKVLRHVERGREVRDFKLLNGTDTRQIVCRQPLEDARRFAHRPRMRVMSARRGMGPRSANSLSRSRSSGAPPSPEMIHWRTFPLKCSTRLPTLFEASFGLHQMSSSESVFKQRSIRGRWCSWTECLTCLTNAFDRSKRLAFTWNLPP